MAHQSLGAASWEFLSSKTFKLPYPPFFGLANYNPHDDGRLNDERLVEYHGNQLVSLLVWQPARWPWER